MISGARALARSDEQALDFEPPVVLDETASRKEARRVGFLCKRFGDEFVGAGVARLLLQRRVEGVADAGSAFARGNQYTDSEAPSSPGDRRFLDVAMTRKGAGAECNERKVERVSLPPHFRRGHFSAGDGHPAQQADRSRATASPFPGTSIGRTRTPPLMAPDDKDRCARAGATDMRLRLAFLHLHVPVDSTAAPVRPFHSDADIEVGMKLHGLLAVLLVTGCASVETDTSADGATKVAGEDARKSGCVEMTGSRIPKCDREGMSATTQVDVRGAEGGDTRATLQRWRIDGPASRTGRR